MTTRSERLEIYAAIHKEIEQLTCNYCKDTLDVLKKYPIPAEILFSKDRLTWASGTFQSLIFSTLEVWVVANLIKADEEVLH